MPEPRDTFSQPIEASVLSRTAQPSSAVYIYYMHILTTQLIYKKAASKMSKNKNIFFRTPAPSLPHKRARKSGCKENRFTFVQEMLHPL